MFNPRPTNKNAQPHYRFGHSAASELYIPRDPSSSLRTNHQSFEGRADPHMQRVSNGATGGRSGRMSQCIRGIKTRLLTQRIQESQCTDQHLHTLRVCTDLRLRDCGIWLARLALCNCSQHLASYLGFSGQRPYEDNPTPYDSWHGDDHECREKNLSPNVPIGSVQTSPAFHPETEESDSSISRQRYGFGKGKKLGNILLTLQSTYKVNLKWWPLPRMRHLRQKIRQHWQS
jgi:hypothetical protein